MIQRSHLELCVLAGLLSLLVPNLCRAMDFEPRRLDNTTVFVIASGQIVPGDAERMMSVFLPLPRNGLNALVLNSTGGSVVASEALAAAIRRLRVPVIVGEKSVCVSACFILFAASPAKYYVPGASIGVHSAMSGGHETLDSMGITTSMARSAAEMGAPDAIIGRMVTTPPGSVAWLSEGELAAMGAYRLDAPATASAPTVPMPQSSPPATAVAPVAPAMKRSAPAIPADVQSQSFQEGRADRLGWEQWFAMLHGDTRLGADYWTGERHKLRPGNCIGTVEFQQGCLAARQRLSRPDMRRKTDPQYW